ncbi:MAG: hypothetical protein O9248_00405 [Rhodobacteraceae bacterium]|nr:hypothetical protein [Paracoccaceae bacterium]
MTSTTEFTEFDRNCSERASEALERSTAATVCLNVVNNVTAAVAAVDVETVEAEVSVRQVVAVKMLGDAVEADAVGERALHCLEDLRVAANALGDREGRRIVQRVSDAITGPNLLACGVQLGLRITQ